MMPEKAALVIRSIDIFFSGAIRGFAFYDANHTQLFKIGTLSNLECSTVEIHEDEVIVGVVARLYEEFESCYTDFRFEISKLV